jgi:hypothetical protein
MNVLALAMSHITNPLTFVASSIGMN